MVCCRAVTATGCCGMDSGLIWRWACLQVCMPVAGRHKALKRGGGGGDTKQGGMGGGGGLKKN
jgi:hypothetical protein